MVSLVIGLLLIGVVVEDVIATTLTLGEGTGPLTRRVLRFAWRGLFGLQRRRGGRRLLGNAGALLLAVTVMIWVALFWGGWSLVFLGSGTVIDASTGERASALDVVYYAGYSVFTLGIGDFVADEAGWRVMTSLASFSGLVLVTFAITYLFSVVSAVVSRRAVATQIHSLGDSAEDILVRGWDDGSFSPAFTSHLIALSAQLASVAEQHLAYPVLHYFRSREARASAPVVASRLDDAVVLLEAAVAQPVRLPAAVTSPLRRVLDRYVETASGTGAVLHSVSAPPRPGTTRLVAAGVPLADVGELARRLDADAGRRVRLRQLVEDAGWNWDP